MRELLYIWSSQSLDILVPKKRGEGFLKVPLGHHSDPTIGHIETLIRSEYACGLDGHLTFVFSRNPELNKNEIISKALPLLLQRYSCEGMREITRTEWFKILYKTLGIDA